MPDTISKPIGDAVATDPDEEMVYPIPRRVKRKFQDDVDTINPGTRKRQIDRRLAKYNLGISKDYIRLAKLHRAKAKLHKSLGTFPTSSTLRKKTSSASRAGSVLKPKVPERARERQRPNLPTGSTSRKKASSTSPAESMSRPKFQERAKKRQKPNLSPISPKPVEIPTDRTSQTSQSTTEPTKSRYAVVSRLPATLDWRQDSAYVLTPRSHHPRELVSFTIDTFSRELCRWTPRQIISFANVRALSSQLEWSWSPLTLPAQHIILQLIAAFNDIFFLSRLTDDFCWDATLPHRNRTAETRSPGGRITIAVDPAIAKIKDTWLAALLGVLLHEICHAFLIRGCNTNLIPCCGAQCANVVKEEIGVTGHASAWVQLASHVEAVAKEHINPNITLSIRQHIELEFGTSGWFPKKDAVERFHRSHRRMISQFSDTCSKRV